MRSSYEAVGGDMETRAIVSDIDGTLLSHGEPTEGLQRLSKLIERHRRRIRIVYATGRTFQSTWNRITKGILPVPDAIAPLVGTEVWFPPWRGPSGCYALNIGAGWNRAAIMQAMEIFGSSLELQDDCYQSRFKLSYFLKEPALLPLIKQQLKSSTLKARIIYSCSRYLDFLPLRAGKNRAADFCRTRWNIPAEKVLTAGDSGNDLDMLLDSKKLSVIVGNAAKELKHIGDCRTVHISKEPFAAGVLDGADYFNFLSSINN